MNSKILNPPRSILMNPANGSVSKEQDNVKHTTYMALSIRLTGKD
ncbi:hypothetical protein [Rhodocytophaga rosea]|nr:hypothetical protein [Rhodocytophaga rosea]